MTHNFKTMPAWFRLILDGSQTVIVTQSDKNYNVGDTILFQEAELASPGLSGRETEKIITCIVTPKDLEGIIPGWCAIGIKAIDENVRKESVGGQYKRGRRFATKSIPPNVFGKE